MELFEREPGLIAKLKKTASNEQASLSSRSHPSTYSCIHDLLRRAPDTIFRFRPGDLDSHAEGRYSFNQLVHAWQHASEQRKSDGGSFPDVRKKNSMKSIPFSEVILHCACAKCTNGIARDLKCKPFDFGSGNEQVREKKN